MRFAIIAALAVMLAAPPFARAGDEDSQDPKAYTQEDSHPLKIVSYLLAPVGFLLEWTVARPLHHLATDSAAAPIFGEDAEDRINTPPAPLAEIPPQSDFTRESRSSSERPAREITIAPPPALANAPAFSTSQPAPAAAPSAAIGQPVLH